MIEGICKCTEITPKYWHDIKFLRDELFKINLKSLANPDCQYCKGKGLMLISEKF